jgi:hypothetical protein
MPHLRPRARRLSPTGWAILAAMVGLVLSLAIFAVLEVAGG